MHKLLLTMSLFLSSSIVLASNSEGAYVNHQADETISLSSGGLTNEYPVLFDEPIDIHNFPSRDNYPKSRGLRVSDRYLKQGINKLYRWENANYQHLTELETSKLKSYVQSYEDSMLMSLNYGIASRSSLDMNAELMQLAPVLEKMPLYRAKLYYPLILPKSWRNQLQGLQFRFPNYVVAPAHYMSEDFKYALLKHNLQPDEELVLLWGARNSAPNQHFV